MHRVAMFALVSAALLPANLIPHAFAQSGQPIEDSTPWDPEQVPAQAAFDFGSKAEPTLTCAPGKYCALALETGETIQSTEADRDHWSVTLTVYGAGRLAKPVILVTPHAAGLADELTIKTLTASQRARSYNVKLISDAEKWTQLTAFRYPTGQ